MSKQFRSLGPYLLAALLAAGASSSPVEAQPSTADVVRFLEQSTFGPAPHVMSHVQEIGYEAFLQEQLGAPTSPYPNLAVWPQTRPATCVGECQRDNYTMYQLQKHFFSNALYGPDQLRQRMAFALMQILVTANPEIPLPSWMRGYQQLLYDGALGNFRELLYNITISPTMGRYLDMVNNRCQTRTPPNVLECRNGLPTKPNENYAREILQLFSIGTEWLNLDGTPISDGAGGTYPTYDQETVEELSRVFTGWILAPALPGPPEVGGTVPNYRDPMQVRVNGLGQEDYHDKGPKSLLWGFSLPGQQGARAELNATIDHIAYHWNVAPFMCRRLIQHLVTSNPSPAYVQRVVGAWWSHYTSPTQLFEVAKAIMLDPEARGDSRPEPTYGHLREPVLFMTGLLRAFYATSDGVLSNVSLGGAYQIGSANLEQDVFRSPTVFNFYPPDYELPGVDGVLAPEFGIHSSLTALRRNNFVQRIVYLNIAPAPPDRPVGTTIDWNAYGSLAANYPDALIDWLNTLLLHGSMPADMRTRIRNAILTVPASQGLQRARMAVYLIATSSQYQVER